MVRASLAFLLWMLFIVFVEEMTGEPVSDTTILLTTIMVMGSAATTERGRRY